ncbi:MAG: GNAT family N-acetyltransferase, partial [Myxococcota bacterium]
GDADLGAAAFASAAWMVLVAGSEVLATARAISDGHKTSYVADVAVHPDLRGRGLGRFLVQRMMAHPCVRHTRVDLMTRDSGGFYAGLGFVRLAEREIWRFAPGH